MSPLREQRLNHLRPDGPFGEYAREIFEEAGSGSLAEPFSPRLGSVLTRPHYEWAHMCRGILLLSLTLVLTAWGNDDGTQPSQDAQVDPACGVVTHQREFTAAGDASVDGARGFEFGGDLLILTAEPAHHLRIAWRKHS